MDPLTREERESFRQYAGNNREEPDGSECQWANHTIRLLDEADALREENVRLRQRVEELEREAKVHWKVDHPRYPACSHCNEAWPCPTVRALEGEE